MLGPVGNTPAPSAPVNSTSAAAQMASEATAYTPLSAREIQAAFDHAMSFKDKDIPNMIQLLKPLATQGHITAQTILGISYANGLTKGITTDPDNVDFAEAIKYFTLAAEQGDIFSQAQLWQLYYKGETKGRTAHPDNIDFAEVIKWCKLAAKKGKSMAQTTLGLCYQHGTTTGKTPNPANEAHPQACYYFRKAFESPDLTEANKRNIKDMMTRAITDFRTSAEDKALYSYHLKLIENPTYIQDTIDDSDANCLQMIKELVRYERPLLTDDAFDDYLMAIFEQNSAYLTPLLIFMKPEDKARFARNLHKTHPAQERTVMQDMIDDPNTPDLLRVTTEFNLTHDLIMEERAAAATSDVMVYQKHLPTLIKCRTAMAALKAAGECAEEQDVITEFVNELHNAYRALVSSGPGAGHL